MKQVCIIALLAATTFAEDKKQIEPLVTLKTDGGEVTCIGFSSDGRSFYSGALDSHVSIWTTKAWKRSASINPGAPPKARPGEHRDEFRSLDACAVGPKAARVLVASGGDLVAEYLLPSGKLIASHRLATNSDSLAVNPTGSEAAAGLGSKIRLFRARPWIKRATLTASGTVTTLLYAPEETLLAAAVAHGGVQLWDSAQGTLVRTLRGDGNVQQMSFSPDSRWLAAATWDVGQKHHVQIWNVVTGSEETRLKGHSDDVWGVAFSPDGKFIASSDTSGDVRLWKAGTWDQCLQLHAAGGYEVAISSDGHWLAAGGGTWEISVWDLRSLIQMCR